MVEGALNVLRDVHADRARADVVGAPATRLQLYGDGTARPG